MKKVSFYISILMGLNFLLWGCGHHHIKIQDSDFDFENENVKFQEETYNVEKTNAKLVISEIVFPAGKLVIGPTSEGLLKGRFKYSNEEWKPRITFNEDSNEANFSIRPKHHGDDYHYEDSDICRWYIDFNPEVNHDIEIGAGACQGNINLEGFNLKHVELNVGAGEIKVNLKNTSVPRFEMNVGAGKASVDLTGKWNNNLKAEINGGVGEITLKLPKDTDVRVEVNGLLGEVEADGFDKDGNIYTNTLHGKTEFKLKIEITGAIGQVNLELE